MKQSQLITIEGHYVKSIHAKVIPNKTILCEVNVNRRVDLPLVNCSNRKVEIKPGTILGEVSPVKVKVCRE